MLPAATLVVGFLALAVPAIAATKPPWQWTVNERLASRFDPAARRARIAAATAREGRRDRPGRPVDHTRLGDEIDGKFNPELLLPTELFENLVNSSFVSLPRVYPRWVQQQTDDVFRDRAEWDDFSRIVADYAAALKRQRELLESSAAAAPAALDGISKELERLRGDLCAAEATALRATRKAFGAERFDRFLYTAIAPSTGLAVMPASEATLAKQQSVLRRQAEQCQ